MGVRPLVWISSLFCAVLLSPGNAQPHQAPILPALIAVEPDNGVTTPGSSVILDGTGFTPDTRVYFGGLQVRDVKFIGPSKLQVITPFLRPGDYKVQLKSGEMTLRSEVRFKALTSKTDLELDRIEALAKQGKAQEAIDALIAIAKIVPDYQVRAFAHFEAAQIALENADWWRWAGEAGAIFENADKSGAAVQTSWQYRLCMDRSDYYLPTGGDADRDMTEADWTVSYDVTQNPEPRFFRGLINARYGNLQQAKVDSDFILAQEPNNASYRALETYIAVLNGNKSAPESFSEETIADGRALGLLGEAAFLSGDLGSAAARWEKAGKVDPLGAGLACWAGKKHLAGGQQRIAQSLLNECTVMAPNSKDAREAQELLAKSQAPRR